MRPPNTKPSSSDTSVLTVRLLNYYSRALDHGDIADELPWSEVRRAIHELLDKSPAPDLQRLNKLADEAEAALERVEASAKRAIVASQVKAPEGGSHGVDLLVEFSPGDRCAPHDQGGSVGVHGSSTGDRGSKVANVVRHGPKVWHKSASGRRQPARGPVVLRDASATSWARR